MNWAGCCKPEVYGNRLFHAEDCPETPSVVLTKAEATDYRTQKRAEMAARAAHPAKGAKVPLRSVRDPGYVDAHIDDADDIGGWRI